MTCRARAWPIAAAWCSIGGFSSRRGSSKTRAEIAALVQKAQSRMPAVKFSIEDRLIFEPTRAPEDAPLIGALTSAIEQVTGRKASLVASPGTYDQKHVARIAGVPHCVAYGPGELAMAHQPDEYCSVDDIISCTKVLALAVMKLASFVTLDSSDSRLQGSPYVSDPGKDHDDRTGDGGAVETALALRVVGAGARRSDSGGEGQGHLLLDAGRQALHRLQQPVDVRQHRPRRSARHQGDPGSGGVAGLRQPVHGHRSARAARPEARGDLSRRHRRLLLHQRRRRSQRERHPHRAAGHRPSQDPRALSLVSRRHRRGAHRHRRSAPLGDGARHARHHPRAASVSRDAARHRQRRRRARRSSKRSSCSRGRRPSRASSSKR